MTDDNISRAAALKTLELCVKQTEHFDSDVASFVRELLVAIRSLPPSPERALLDENNALRAALAASGADCPFCGLPASDLAKCQSGFPGCARADDLMLAPSPVEGEGLREALSEAVYAIANSSGDTQRPSGRDFDYEDFCVWAEQWLPRARAALSPQSPTGEEEA